MRESPYWSVRVRTGLWAVARFLHVLRHARVASTDPCDGRPSLRSMFCEKPPPCVCDVVRLCSEGMH